MADTSWKAFERRIAAIFGGTRRGADYGDARGGKSDIICPGRSIECKLLARPTFSQLLAAARQAERAATHDELPIAIVKKKHQDDADALVIMRLETYSAWHVEQRVTPRAEIGTDGEVDPADGTHS